MVQSETRQKSMNRNKKMNVRIKGILVFLLQITLAYGQGGHDARCYLENGGSAENFIVSEDISVGAIIGKLKINGNPSPLNGNIQLSLRERDRDAPVQIEAGTKDLILTSPLDKEGERGPASVYVNVVCDRLHSENIPSFVIPVNIRITDVNDNAPAWKGAPYSISLSETTVVGTRILQGARAIDADQPGPFSTVEYSVLPGPFSDYVDFVNPLEGTLQLKKPLDFEQLKNFTVKLRAQDQGNPPKFSDTFLRVFIIDADDQNPRFEFESYSAELPTDGKTGKLKIHPKAIKAWDQDEGIQADIHYTISASSSPDAKYFSINPKSAIIELISPTDITKTTLVVRATQVDNKDRYSLATVNIMRSEKFRHDLIPEMSISNDNRYSSSSSPSLITPTAMTSKQLQFIQPKHQISVRENIPAGTRILSLPTNRPGERNNLHYTILERDQVEFFEIGQYGDVILRKQLDFEKIVKHIFHVKVVDEQLNEATCQVIVDVLNINDWDPRFRESHYKFRLPSKGSLNESYSVPMAVGRIEAADGDVGDKINFNLRGVHSSLFSIDQRGMIWLKEPLHNIQKSELSLIATATDTGQRSTSVPVTFVMDPEPHQGKLTSFTSILAMLFIIFFIIVILISIFVYKRKSNQIHSNLPSMQSSAGLVSQEKRLMSTHMHDASQDQQINFHNSVGNLSPGSSSIMGSLFEPQTHHHVNDNKSTIGALARSGYRGRLYNTQQQLPTNDDIEKDSITNSDATKDLNIMNRVENQRNKKLSWQHDDFHKNDVSGSLDLNGSTENNLIVYF